MSHDEFSLIQEWTKEAQQQDSEGITVGIGDDAAVFSVSPGMEIVACCDTMIETVHFLRETMSPFDIGYKGTISNISDVAAMGGIPRFALVSIGVSAAWSPVECRQIYDGIFAACRTYGVRLLGGDTVSTPDALHLSITLLGEVEAGRAIRRTAAKPGDAVFTTGELGESAAGLHALFAACDGSGEVDAAWLPLVEKHQRPTAQVTAGRILNKFARTGALNDISDGLASELWEIAEASGVSITVEKELVPISETLRQYAEAVAKDPYDWAFFGGEDYQLVGTAPAAEMDALARLFSQNGLPFYRIGTVTAGEPSVFLLDGQDRVAPLTKAGYNHFKS